MSAKNSGHGKNIPEIIQRANLIIKKEASMKFYNEKETYILKQMNWGVLVYELVFCSQGQYAVPKG